MRVTSYNLKVMKVALRAIASSSYETHARSQVTQIPDRQNFRRRTANDRPALNVWQCLSLIRIVYSLLRGRPDPAETVKPDALN